MRAWTSLAVICAAGVFACGGGNQNQPPAAAATPPPKSDGVIRPITQGQLKVAHYSSPDGLVGVVLDRTGDHPKAQVNGEKDVYELTMEEDRYAGDLRGHWLKKPDGKNLLYLSSGGDLRIFRGRDDIYLNSDKEAQPLPEATVKGQWVRPKSAYDTAIAQLAPLTVRKRFEQFKPQDSGNLAKVAEAYGLVTSEMFVHLTDKGAKDAHWAPASRHIDNTIQGLGGPFGGWSTNDTWDKSKPGLAKYGGKLGHNKIEFGSPARMHMETLKGWPAPVAAGTPGILWEVDDGHVTFVTLDGGRYEISIPNGDEPIVQPGAGDQSTWPSPLQHALLDVDQIRGFAKGGAIPDQQGKDIEALDDAWWACINDVWKKAKADVDKIEASGASANDKWGRESGVQKSAELKALPTCEPQAKKLEAGLVKMIEARNAERLTVMEKARPKALAAK